MKKLALLLCLLLSLLPSYLFGSFEILSSVSQTFFLEDKSRQNSDFKTYKEMNFSEDNKKTTYT